MTTSSDTGTLHFYMVRGLIREAQHWGALPTRLQAVFPHARVSCLDLPGAGLAYRQRSPLQVAQMVLQMRQEFLQLRRPGEKAVLVAISLGGMIAAQWLQTFAHDFHQVVLINTSFGGVSPLVQRLRPGAWGSMAQVLLAPSARKEATILRLVSNNPDAQRSALPLWNQIRTERPVSLANTARQLWAASRFRLGPFKPDIPVLLLAGTRDRMVSVECSRAIARHWQAPLLEHPSAGHDLPLDDPDWIVRQVAGFVPT